MSTRVADVAAPAHPDTALDRRGFLVSGVVLTGLLLTRPHVAVGRWLHDLRTPRVDAFAVAPAAFGLATFAPHVGSVFTARAADLSDVPLRLVEATGFAIRTADIERFDGEAFSLIFEAPIGTSLGSGQRVLTHPAVSSKSIFLSPVGRGLVVQDYQAIFDLRSLRASTTIRKPG